MEYETREQQMGSEGATRKMRNGRHWSGPNTFVVNHLRKPVYSDFVSFGVLMPNNKVQGPHVHPAQTLGQESN